MNALDLLKKKLFPGMAIGGAGMAYSNDSEAAIPVSHGSPHVFDRFDMSKIGTGEGAQAYGHGLYFAEGYDSPTAQSYAKALMDQMPDAVNHSIARFVGKNPPSHDEIADELISAGFPRDKVSSDLTSLIRQISLGTDPYDGSVTNAVLNKYDELGKLVPSEGHVYNADLKWPDPAREASDPLSGHHFLNWDAPLSEQPSIIQDKFHTLKPHNVNLNMSGGPYTDLTVKGHDVYNYLSRAYSSPEKASELLKGLGIPGIKYLDQASRRDGVGSYNYVTFDDKIPEVKTRNGIAPKLDPTLLAAVPGVAAMSYLAPSLAEASPYDQLKSLAKKNFNTLLDYTPIIGGVKGMAEAKNPIDMAASVASLPFDMWGLHGAGAAAMPLLGGITKKFNFKNIDFDPRFDSSGRKNELERLKSLTTEVSPVHDEAPIARLEDYLGHGFATSFFDRTATGDLEKVNGVKVGTKMQGGQDWMTMTPGQVTASAIGPINAHKELVDYLAKETGKPVLFLPHRMAPTGGDYSTQTGETMLRYAKNNMGSEGREEVNNMIRGFIPGFTTIGSEKGIQMFRNAKGDTRKAIQNQMDVQFRDKGGLSYGEARLAVADPTQVNAMEGGLHNMGMFDHNAPIITNSGHNTYSHALPGNMIGRLDRDIPVYALLPEHAKLRGVTDPWNPTQQDIRSLQMKPFGGIITEELLKKLGY